jgi:hypothetical protein
MHTKVVIAERQCVRGLIRQSHELLQRLQAA